MNVDSEILKNTVRSHGILLEYEVENKIRNTLMQLGVKDTGISSERSKMLAYGQPLLRKFVEVDVYLHYSLNPDRLSDLYHGGKPLFYETRPNVIDYQIIQCKGHEPDGFLLTNAIKTPSRFDLHFMIHRDRFPNKHQGYPCMTRYLKVNPEIVYIDWAYFYKGDTRKKDELEFYKQDRDGGENKFLIAVEQLNKSLLAFKDNKPESDNTQILYRICPIIVTNADIYTIEVSGETVNVHNQIPWAVYENKAKREYFAENYPFFDYFYLVNSGHLPEFIENYKEIVCNNGGMEYKTKPQHFSDFTFSNQV